jgi:dihydroorotate dehydrogenase (fumarate)
LTINLTTHYGSLKLRSPLVVGACPLTADEQTRLAMESAGAGAIVLPSLFEEQVILWNERSGHALTQRDQQLLERSRRMGVEQSHASADTYVAMVNQATARSSIPIIASLNGESGGNWPAFAKELQQAGAAAIELNIHHAPPRDFSAPRDAEDRVVKLVAKIDAVIDIPLFLKLGRDYTSLSHLTHRLLSGVHGLVLYGRTPDIDICLDSLQLKTTWGLTQSGSIMESIGAIMRVHGFCPAMPLAASGGIGSPGDVIKVLLAGADVAMVTSAIYREGPDVIRTFIDGLIVFMQRHRMHSIRELQTSRPLEFSSEQERHDYVKALSTRLQASDVASDENALHGDRWGHRDAPR